MLRAYKAKHFILKHYPNTELLFDKSISAFVWKTEHGDLSLDNLQLWDCFDYNLTVIKKSLLSIKVNTMAKINKCIREYPIYY